ncbi:MAG: leucine-rich repeat protein [Clostridia bacterium]|nr:leucine-rich repeat protein [Clostridia bacterium]
MQFSEKIVFLRKKRNISQEQLAKKMQVSRQAVYKWEANLSTPELEKIKKMAQIFDVSYDILLNDGIDLNEHFANIKEGPEETEKKRETEEIDIKEEVTGTSDTDAPIPKKPQNKALLWVIVGTSLAIMALIVIIFSINALWNNGDGSNVEIPPLGSETDGSLTTETNGATNQPSKPDNTTSSDTESSDTTSDSLLPDTDTQIKDSTLNSDDGTLDNDTQGDSNLENDPHVCDFSHWSIVKHVSCFENGEEISSCTCGNTTKRTIYANGHLNVVTLEAIEPSCERIGLTEGSKCTACKEVIIPQQLIKNSHNFVDGVCEKCSSPMYTEEIIYGFKNSKWQVTGLQKECTDEVIYISPYYQDPETGDLHKVEGVYSIGGDNVKELIIPEGIKTIRYSAFHNKMTNLEAIHIPTTVDEIYPEIFEMCHNISRVYISDANIWCKQISVATQLMAETPKPIFTSSYDMYLKGELLEELHLSSEVQRILPHTFTNCKSIKSVIMDEVAQVRDVLEYAFSWCYNLTYAELDGSIHRDAFSYSTELKTVKLLPNAYFIGSYANEIPLSGCFKLSEIYCNSKHEDGRKCTYEGAIKYVHHDMNAESKIKTTDDGYVYIDTGDDVYLLSYVGNSSAITLPRSINGKSYTIVAQFLRGTSSSVRIASVIIPKEVLIIEKGAYIFFSPKNIFCEATKKPNGWEDKWDSETIVWGYTITE